MSALGLFVCVVLCITLSAVWSGCESGMYSLSRTRVEAEAHAGSLRARWIQRLLVDDSRLLITFLVATCLMEEAATHLLAELLGQSAIPDAWQELAVMLLLTPPMLFFGGLLPKDLFRRRPHTLVGWCAPLIRVANVVLWPLVMPLRLVVGLIFRMTGVKEQDLVRVQGREAVIDLLRERDLALSPELERMAHKVLDLRSLTVEKVMVPWSKVESLPLDASQSSHWQQLNQSPFSRLPVVDGAGRAVGYVHQLELLAAGAESPLQDHLRPLIAVPSDLPLDRTLARLRQSGLRAAIVGSLARPVGLVTLKDLVEEISGELHRW